MASRTSSASAAGTASGPASGPASRTAPPAAVPTPIDPAGFNWALVRSFLAVLDAGSVMRAARQIGAQQPTLSRHIAELEAQLGVPLFERTGRGVAPTAIAQSIAEAARQMQAGAEAVSRALTGARHVTSGTVRITASTTAAAFLLPQLILRFHEEEPSIQIELVASNEVSNLLRREADIAVRMVQPAQDALVARKLADVAIVACAHERYLLRAGTPRRPQDLQQHRVLAGDRNESIMQGMQTLGMPAQRSTFPVRTDDFVAYAKLVEAGAGIGFVPRYVVARLPGVVPVLPELKIPTFPCWLAVHREIRASPVIRRTFDFLAAEIRGELG